MVVLQPLDSCDTGCSSELSGKGLHMAGCAVLSGHHKARSNAMV
jgi:hypothetical protein